MLQQFSWTTFLVFFAVISALWYLALLLTVCRKDAIAFLSGPVSKPSVASAAKSSADENQKDATKHEIMGKSKMPEGLELVSMGALSFSVGQNAAYTNEESRTDQLGLIPDVLQEFKEIFGILVLSCYCLSLNWKK